MASGASSASSGTKARGKRGKSTLLHKTTTVSKHRLPPAPIHPPPQRER